ncbi:unnamed protein product, partial [Ectocarpus sp. 6 AP-2014]
MGWSSCGTLWRARYRRRCLLSCLALFAPAVVPPAGAQVSTTTCGSSSPLRVETVAEAGALGAAVDCTDGGTVEAVWAGAVTLTAPISVGTGTFLSITGEDDSAEVLGGGQTQMFYVSSSGGLTLTDLRLSGGSAASGGAVYASAASIALNSCVFDGNFATAGDGGAVAVEGGDLTIVGGEFSGNSASGNGGAVFATDAAVVIQDGARFEGNKAVEGGGLYCGGAENSTTTTVPSSSSAAAATCSLSGAVFGANNASSETIVDFDLIEAPWVTLYGGGAAAFYRGVVDITGSEFLGNYAQVSGGAVYGGTDAVLTIDGSSFEENTTPGYGGGLAASSAVLGGDTLLRNNSATSNGAGVFGWDEDGEIELHDILCTENTATGHGGCLYVAGGGVVNNGTVMITNEGKYGGCIWDSFDLGGSQVTVEGGRFTDNRALELGGAFVAWGTPTVLTITGGFFSNNTAKFYGGFIFLEEEASLSCEGATIRDHYAGDQGGGIYGRDATWVNSSCDLIGNAAPQGAAVYLTHTVMAANLKNHEVTDNVASGGSVLYATETALFATGLNFQSGVGLQEDSSNRAIQLEGETTLVADGCVFGGWMGDTVIHNANTAEGSLALDSCDFSESAAVMVVGSPHSDALIRNAFVGHHTIDNAAVVDGSPVLVDNAFGCDSGICAAGECVDSVLGVLCECLEDGVCLNDGGALSISLLVEPPNVTYSPDPVYFELLVSASADGVTPTIWNLTFEADGLELSPFPSSGVLSPGGNVTVMVTGSPLRQDVGGDLVSRFAVSSVGRGGGGTAESSSSSTGVELEVESAFYLCQAFEYAVPVDGDDDTAVSCEQCVAIDGAEGVDCELPGATLASLPVREGYWRSGEESSTVLACIHAESCAGATQVSTAEDYCSSGYEGPYCASCQAGYGTGIGNTCHPCDDTRSRWLILAGSLFTLVTLLVLGLAIVFLVGGLDAVEGVRRTVSRSLSVSTKLPLGRRSASVGSGAAAAAEGAVPGIAASFAPAFEEGKGERNSFQGKQQQQQQQQQTAVDFFDDGLLRSSSKSPDTAVGGRNTGRFSGVLLPSATTASGAQRHATLGPSTGGGGGGGGVQTDLDRAREGWRKEDEKSAACCGIGEKIKRWAARLPMDKLKILVVVWQILTVFPTITGAEFPPAYAQFLSIIDFINLDIGSIFSGMCILPRVSFYQRLLVTTVTPIGLAGVLLLTYTMAKGRAGIGSASVVARKAAWSRHMAAGLLLTFLVFTSTSTVVFKTFACDDQAVEGESYLRADYSLSCNTVTHTWYKVYAGIMIVVYPIGIPLLYAFILWINRDSLNPGPRPKATDDDDDDDEAVAAAQDADASGWSVASRKAGGGGGGGDGEHVSKETPEELEERLQKRRQNPDLVPSMFLWKDF